MSRRNKYNSPFEFYLVILSITGVILAAIIALNQSRSFVIEQAETRIRDVLMEAEALHHYVQREMHPAMYALKEQERLPHDFYSPEMLSSSYITRHVFNQYNKIRQNSQLPLVEYRMASSNPRNKQNLADSLERVWLNIFNQDTSIKKLSGIIELHGEKHFYYAKPFLKIEAQCLICHGQKKNAPADLKEYYTWESGFDLKLGEIPAIEVIKTPIVAEFKAFDRFELIIYITAFLLIVMLILYYKILITNRLVVNKNVEIEINLKKLKEAQNQLVQAEKMASLGILTAGVAHEINNPLNFINGAYIGFERLFNQPSPYNPEKIKYLLDSLKTGLDRCTNIVKSLSNFSRSSEQLDEACDIHSIINNCLLILTHQYKNRIEIIKEYESYLPEVIGNCGKLHQVFINLLMNSIQAINKVGVIKIVTKKEPTKVLISITDNGCGIEENNLTRIFDPFFTTKAPGEGTGLGLSITYNIIIEHKGSINFNSKPGEGTTVTIRIPFLSI